MGSVVSGTCYSTRKTTLNSQHPHGQSLQFQRIQHPGIHVLQIHASKSFRYTMKIIFKRIKGLDNSWWRFRNAIQCIFTERFCNRGWEATQQICGHGVRMIVFELLVTTCSVALFTEEARSESLRFFKCRVYIGRRSNRFAILCRAIKDIK